MRSGFVCSLGPRVGGGSPPARSENQAWSRFSQDPQGEAGRASVLFNYLGQTDTADSGLLKPIGEPGGAAVAPDDIYLALRGMRTLSVRLKRHEETALALAHSPARTISPGGPATARSAAGIFARSALPALSTASASKKAAS